MKRLLFVTALMMIACIATAAQQYYNFPDATRFNDADRMLIYDSYSAVSRNITGKQLASVAYQAAWNPDYVKVFQANSTATNGPNAGVRSVNATRDRRGVITGMTLEDGSSFRGIPVLNHTYVYPFNGMTNVRRTTPLVVGTTMAVRGIIAVPSISIESVSGVPIMGLYYAGKNSQGQKTFGYVNQTAPNQDLVDALFWGTASVGTLTANTTYTIRTALDTSWGRSLNYTINSGIGFKIINNTATSAATNAPSFGLNACRGVFPTYSTGTIFARYSANANGTYICRSTFRTGSAL